MSAMNPEQATQLLAAWLNASPLNDLPLLDVGGDGVTPTLHAGNHPRLRCSEELVTAVGHIAEAIIADWNGNRTIEGVAYLVYRRQADGSPEPLYVGIANSANKRGDNHSVLWGSRGARFCDNYKSNGHVDCLSRSLLEGYVGYAPWVSALFGPGANAHGPDMPTLLRPTFVHLEVWNAEARRILPGAPDAPLYVEEMLRLWVLKSAGLGAQLLNRDGN